MMFSRKINTPVQIIKDPLLEKAGVKLYIKREDLIHPYISGNKWRKLKYNFLYANEKGYKTILTFGGAYSNHIAAVATAGKECSLKTIGIIRGEEHFPLNPTLEYARNQGMEFIYWSREKYRDKLNAADFLTLEQQIGKFFYIPEGGTNSLAIEGVKEIMQDDTTRPDYVCSAVGTGGTASGLILSENRTFKVLGFSALKNSGFLEKEIEQLIGGKHLGWNLINEYHFGGYAKFNQTLINFINNFYRKNNIELDPIYTGKMLYGVFDLVEKGYFANPCKILAIHTGGLQGKRGFNERYNNLLL